MSEWVLGCSVICSVLGLLMTVCTGSDQAQGGTIGQSGLVKMNAYQWVSSQFVVNVEKDYET